MVQTWLQRYILWERSVKWITILHLGKIDRVRALSTEKSERLVGHRSYGVEDGMIVYYNLQKERSGSLYTEKNMQISTSGSNFSLPPAANNGLGIRHRWQVTRLCWHGIADYWIIPIPVYANLQPYQYHGSVYGVIPAKTGYLKPLVNGTQRCLYQRDRVKITLNGNSYSWWWYCECQR